MTGGAGLDGLKSTQKAAMFMLARGEAHARTRVAKLGLEEIRDITQTMSRLGRLFGATVEALLNDFLERLGGTAGLVGEPIGILVNNRLVARGEVVILEDRLAVMTQETKTSREWAAIKREMMLR